MSYFGCTCPAMSVPHCHTMSDCPPETPRRVGHRHCVYGGIGCNIDHDQIARAAIGVDNDRVLTHILDTAEFR